MHLYLFGISTDRFGERTFPAFVESPLDSTFVRFIQSVLEWNAHRDGGIVRICICADFLRILGAFYQYFVDIDSDYLSNITTYMHRERRRIIRRSGRGRKEKRTRIYEINLEAIFTFCHADRNLPNKIKFFCFARGELHFSRGNELVYDGDRVL